MSTLGKYAAVFIVGALICFLFTWKCDRYSSQIQDLTDSLKIEQQVNATIDKAREELVRQNNETFRKYQQDSAFRSKKIDSLQLINEKLKANFTSHRDTIVKLHFKLDSAFAANDTVGVWDYADSLNNALVRTDAALTQLQIGRDSLESEMRDRITGLQNTIKELQDQIIQFKELLTECTNNNAALYKTAQKAVKKAKLSTLLNKIGIGLAAVVAAVLIIHK
jgi:hypothetical protein